MRHNTRLTLLALTALLALGCSDNEPLIPDNDYLPELPPVEEPEPLAEVENVVDQMPDAFFARYCLVRFDTNGDGVLTMREAEAAQVISAAEDPEELREDHYRFVSLEGIGYLKNLHTLEIKSSVMDSLDLRHNSHLRSLTFDIPQGTCRLKSLRASGTQIEALKLPLSELKLLDVRNTPIRTLEVSDCPLNLLDVRYCEALEELSCRNLPLRELELRYTTRLEEVTIEACALERLDVSNCTNLLTLEASDNQLVELNLKHNLSLKELDLARNQLTQLTLTDLVRLEELDIRENLLTTLDITPCDRLEKLHIEKNNITELNTDLNSYLRELHCAHNALQLLDLTTNSQLEWLVCHDNQLEQLALSKANRELQLQGEQNAFSTLDLSHLEHPVWQSRGEQTTEEPYASFAHQPLLEVLTLSEWVERIGVEQLSTCPALRKVILNAIEVPELVGELPTEPLRATLYVPQESLERYTASAWATLFEEIRPL